jgi:hypothetical protein
VVVTTKEHDPDPWLFGKVYHWTVWIAIFLNPFLIAIIVTFAEVR